MTKHRKQQVRRAREHSRLAQVQIARNEIRKTNAGVAR